MKDRLVWVVVTIPFSSEGIERIQNAQMALPELLDLADMTIVNFNDILKEKVGAYSIHQAFREMDKHLVDLINGLTKLQGLKPEPGLVNIDFSNVERLTRESGLGFVGTGSGLRFIDAFEDALAKNYCEADLTGARGAVVYIEGTRSILSLREIEEIPRILSEKYGIGTVYWGVRYNWRVYNPQVMLLVAGVKSPLVEQFLETR